MMGKESGEPLVKGRFPEWLKVLMYFIVLFLVIAVVYFIVGLLPSGFHSIDWGGACNATMLVFD